MNKRGTGVAFIAMSVFLIASKYLSAAIFSSGITTWDKNMFNNMFDYVGNTLSNFSLLALIIGIAYIAWGEYEEFKDKSR